MIILFNGFVIFKSDQNVKKKFPSTFSILILMYLEKKFFRNAYTSTGLTPSNPNGNDITWEFMETLTELL